MVELEGETDPLQIAMKELKYVYILLLLRKRLIVFFIALFIPYSEKFWQGENLAKLAI